MDECFTLIRVIACLLFNTRANRVFFSRFFPHPLPLLLHPTLILTTLPPPLSPSLLVFVLCARVCARMFVYVLVRVSVRASVALDWFALRCVVLFYFVLFCFCASPECGVLREVQRGRD